MFPLKTIFLFSFLIFSSNCSGETEFLRILKNYVYGWTNAYGVIYHMEILCRKASHNFPGNFEKNKAAFKNHLLAIRHNNGFIEDQHNYKDMFYGTKSLSDNSSGLIAIYNIIYYLTKKEDIDFAQIIKDLELDGIYLNGAFGTGIKAPQNYFLKKGFTAKGTWDKTKFYKIAEEADAFIITIFHTNEDYYKGIHFYAVTKENGKYYVHNIEEKYSPKGYAYDSYSQLKKKINPGFGYYTYLTEIYKK